MPVPIALIVDDPCPLVHVYRYHAEHVHRDAPRTRDGRPLLDSIPNDFLDAFCDVVNRHGVRGKFSIVPAPAARGDIVAGVNGDPEGTRVWLDTAKRRLGPSFDFSPEMISHDLAVDLPSGRLLASGESDWSQTQDRAALTPYIERALRYLRDAGIDATGVTSPWSFGKDVEEEYAASIIAAQRSVFGRTRSWYFLHTLAAHPLVRPWVAVREGDAALVSIPTTTDDVFWTTIDDPRRDAAFARSIADLLLTADGRRGVIRSILDAGGWPLLLTHWQSLFSNGLRTGLLGLEVLLDRIGETLSGEVDWASCSELMEMTIAAGTGRPTCLPPLRPGRPPARPPGGQ